MADDVLLDDEASPRNAGAIRTALMLGAVFERSMRPECFGVRWRVEGINGWWYTRSLPAFLFLATHGIGIDENGSPRMFGYFTEKKNVPHTPRG